MGSYTGFDGNFVCSRKLTAKEQDAIECISDNEDLDREHFGLNKWSSPSLWRVTKDKLLGIDAYEKHADEYLEWLQAIVDTILVPAGVTLSGKCYYKGTDTFYNMGTITVEGDNEVVARDFVSEEEEEEEEEEEDDE